MFKNTGQSPSGLSSWALIYLEQVQVLLYLGII